MEKDMYTYSQNIARLLAHPSILEKAIYKYYQNIAKLLTHSSILEKSHLYVLLKYCKTFGSPLYMFIVLNGNKKFLLNILI